MSRWRIVVVILLLVGPFAVLAAVGAYHLWTLPWGFLSWWPLAGSIAAGYLLAWYWQRQKKLLRPPDFETPRHWTERDDRAWKLVEARAEAGARLDPGKLSDIQHYLAVAQEMAVELAAFYHPNAKDPVSSLTVPEVLAVIELASHDLAELVDRYLPGGHLLTIRDWRLARQAIDWYQSASHLYWAIAAAFSPLNTALRYAAAQVGLTQPFQMLQENLFLWFYTAYVHRVGTYLIDLNSGRLRVGAARYRDLLEGNALPAVGTPPAGAGAGTDPEDAVRQVTVTLLGQVKSGKSSLVNALLGEQRARTDVLPATNGVDRYELRPPPGIPTRLVLFDTIGYGHEGPKADQVAVTRDTAQQSDVLFLVVHAHNPARQADVQVLQDLRGWFASHPELKRPPIVAVVTHIDLLSPALEWAPPYDWQAPSRPKAVSIHDAVEAVREQLGGYVAGVVPVCVAAGKVYGIEEWLLPAVAERLDEVRGVALLRCLRAETDTGKVRKVFHQLLAAAKAMARVAWQNLGQRPANAPPRSPEQRTSP